MIEQLWYNMGLIRYPLMFSGIAILALVVWSSVQLFKADGVADLRTKAWIDAILFWGGFALVSGVLGTLVGITLAAQAIEALGEVEPALVWGGVKVAMLSSEAGFTMLGLAALAWFPLQLRWRFLKSDFGTD